MGRTNLVVCTGLGVGYFESQLHMYQFIFVITAVDVVDELQNFLVRSDLAMCVGGLESRNYTGRIC